MIIKKPNNAVNRFRMFNFVEIYFVHAVCFIFKQMENMHLHALLPILLGIYEIVGAVVFFVALIL
jgi:uncharacterized membrane protein